MEKEIVITVRNLSYEVTILNKKRYADMDHYCKGLTTFTLEYDLITKKHYRKKDKEFYSHAKYTNTYIFPITSIGSFMAFLKSVGMDKENIIVIIKKILPNVVSLDLNFNPDIIPREYQQQYIKALLGNKSSYLVDLEMGRGKSLIAAYAVTELNMRTAILVLPKYIEKWVEDVKKYTDVNDDEIFIIQGYNSILTLLKDGFDKYKFIIISMRTMANYINDYEEKSSNVIMSPYDFFLKSGIGVLLNDETHQEFHAVYKTTLYMDAYKFIGLSATLDTNQLDIKNIHHILFPLDRRISNIVEYVKYIDVYAIRYSISTNKGIAYKTHMGYNHIKYEQSILRNPLFRSNYIDMILHYIEVGYYNRRKSGDKALVFASTIDMCTLLTKAIQNKYPNLDVRRYVEDDPYENLMNADISISTTLGAGTAVDIPQLLTVIQTISMGSLQANKQSFGRLRNLGDTETRFYYTYCGNIGDQYRLHKDRKTQLMPMSKSYHFIEYDKTLRVK